MCWTRLSRITGMSKTTIRTISKNTSKTIVKNITGKKSWECVVEEGAQVTLVLLFFASFDSHVTVRLAGKGAKAFIIGIVIGKYTSDMKLHTLQLHEVPDTTSSLLVKGVFADSAKFVYDGAIVVEKNAQKTDAYQRNENLMLSDQTHAESRPSLEILANDVRCTHGATISALPSDQLWYLATRGIVQVQAQRLLVRGFLEHALVSLQDKEVSARILQRVLNHL